MTDQQAADPRALLQEVVRGADDDTLVQLAENLGGVQAFLDLTFDGMKDAIVAGKAQDSVIGWQIVHGDDVYSYRVVVSAGAAAWEHAEPTDARVTLRMKLPNYMRLITGELDGMQAFMTGSLQVMGDMIFATQVQAMFDTGASGG